MSTAHSSLPWFTPSHKSVLQPGHLQSPPFRSSKECNRQSHKLAPRASTLFVPRTSPTRGSILSSYSLLLQTACLPPAVFTEQLLHCFVPPGSSCLQPAGTESFLYRLPGYPSCLVCRLISQLLRVCQLATAEAASTPSPYTPCHTPQRPGSLLKNVISWV